MLNNYDILKNGLYQLFLESVCNGNNIILEAIEPQLENLNFMCLIDHCDIIESSKLLNLMCKSLNKYEVPFYFDLSDLENIKNAFYDFEEAFYKIYGFEPL